MILLKQPSIVINTEDVPGGWYYMWKTLKSPKGCDLEIFVRDCVREIKAAKDGQIENLIFNCHGLSGRFYFAGLDYPPMDVNKVHYFRPLNGMVKRIIIIACLVSAESENTPYSGHSGNRFCTRLAQTVGCSVVAADSEQQTNEEFGRGWYPFGCIDDFEGNVTEYFPDGKRKTIVSIPWYSVQNDVEFFRQA